MPLLLASTSPRRRDLLTRAGVGFTVIAPGEEVACGGPPRDLAVRRARSKAMGAAAPATGGLVLGVDTVVDLDGQELGKPADLAAAREMLIRLGGRVHAVHTAHCLVRFPDRQRVEAVTSARVRCRQLSAAELEAHLDRGLWRGKAGGYGIQDPDTRFVELVAGDLDTVVGLSMATLRQMLERLTPGTGR